MYLSSPGSTTATSIMSRPSAWVHVRSARISPSEAVFPTTVSIVTGPGWVCCEGLDDAVVSSSPGGTVQAAAKGMELF